MKNNFTDFLKNKRIMGLIFGALIILAIGISVGKHLSHPNDYEALQTVSAPKLLPDGKTVQIDPKGPANQFIKTKKIERGSASVKVNAPGRIVATTQPDRDGKLRLMLESNDTTSLFSDYTQANSNFIRSERNFRRIKDMSTNEAATARDVNDAESDFQKAKAELNENEMKLRALGINPADLNKLKMNTAVLISDVPERQSQEVELGEDVVITFSSFAGDSFHGKVEYLGDAIDPMTRTMKVRITLENGKKKLIPGMFAKVDFGYSRAGTVIVPDTAVFNVEEKEYVFVFDGKDKYTLRQVFTQNIDGDQMIISSGLSDGDIVVTDGALLLKGVVFSY